MATLSAISKFMPATLGGTEVGGLGRGWNKEQYCAFFPANTHLEWCEQAEKTKHGIQIHDK